MWSHHLGPLRDPANHHSSVQLLVGHTSCLRWGTAAQLWVGLCIARASSPFLPGTAASSPEVGPRRCRWATQSHHKGSTLPLLSSTGSLTDAPRKITKDSRPDLNQTQPELVIFLKEKHNITIYRRVSWSHRTAGWLWLVPAAVQGWIKV